VSKAEGGHVAPTVYREMILQICADYPGLPEPRSMTMTEIRFFYEGTRASLKKATAPKQPSIKPR
jgi:hypothetical protein